MFDINILWHIFQFIIYISLLMFFMYRVYENHLIVSKKQFWLRVTVHILLLTLIICLFFTELSPYRSLSPIGCALILILSFVLYKTVTRKNAIFLFFILFILLAVQINALMLARATLDFHILHRFSSYENGDFLLLSSLYCVILFFFVYSLLAKYYKRVVDNDISMRHTKLFFCLPLVYFIALCVFARTTSKTFSGIPKELFLPLLLLNVFALFAFYAALKSIIDNYDVAMEHEKLFSAQNQLKLWEAQYEILQNKIDSDARIRHDWRQHIIAIMGYVENQNLPGLKDYLSDYKDKYLIPDRGPVCDISSLNMLFQYYHHKADEENINLSINTAVLGKCKISTTELTILFGNLLENAIEACSKIPDVQRFIRLKITKQSCKIILLCENSFDGHINRNMDKIVSTKENGGIGLSSVQGIVDRYNGQMKIEHDNNIFKIYAYLEDRN